VGGPAEKEERYSLGMHRTLDEPTNRDCRTIYSNLTLLMLKAMPLQLKPCRNAGMVGVRWCNITGIETAQRAITTARGA
jgi:hypothetical protein